MAGEKLAGEQGKNVTTSWDVLVETPSPEASRIVGEDLETVHRVEEFLQNNYRQYGERDGTELAFRSAGEILGAKLGIKPASLTTIELIEDGQDADTDAFEGMLRDLGMTVIPEDIGGVKRRYFYGKEAGVVQEAYDGFHQLWETKPGTPERKELDIQLGRLMGYPETAVLGDTYTINQNKAIQRKLEQQYPDQLISHTPEHIAEEYSAYEQKIFDAIREYCPDIQKTRGRLQKKTFGQKILGFFSKS